MTQRTELINVAAITIGEQQVRDNPHDEQIEELALDIAANGLLQPIGVYQLTPTTYQLRFGSRRLAAHKMLRRDTIRAEIHSGPPANIKADAVRENIHRRAMTLAEECTAVEHLHNTDGRSVEEIRSIMGKSRDWVYTRLMIPTLPPEIRDATIDGTLTPTHAEILASITDESLRNQLLQHTHNQRWTIAQLKNAADNIQIFQDHSTAVEAGLAAFHERVAPSTVHLECNVCRKPRLPAQLITIKVCADGCQDHTPATGEPDAPQTLTRRKRVATAQH